MPTEASDFVPEILHPLAAILIEKAEYVRAAERRQWAVAVLGPVTKRYGLERLYLLFLLGWRP